MFKIDNIHLSLDDARKELVERWNNVELKNAIELELGEHLLSDFNDKPRAVLTRQICSPDNGFVFFYQCAKYIHAEPFAWEFHGDTFVHFNEEKKGLGRFRVLQNNDRKSTIDIIDFHEAERKKLNEINLKSGQNLVDFHHSLFELLNCDIKKCDNTNWFKRLGRASDYYYYLLLHFVVHGVLFVNMESPEGDENDASFMQNVISPAISKIEEKFGVKPLICRLYPNPETQSEEEDFFWWCYPPKINDFMISYAEKNNLPFKFYL
jgi:hypothetical protein